MKEAVKVVFRANTCIQPKDLSSEDNIILSIALGKGKKPKGFDDDKFSEQLSFPHLFPTGMFGYTTSREKKDFNKEIIPVQAAQCRWDIEYIFMPNSAVKQKRSKVAFQLL